MGLYHLLMVFLNRCTHIGSSKKSSSLVLWVAKSFSIPAWNSFYRLALKTRMVTQSGKYKILQTQDMFLFVKLLRFSLYIVLTSVGECLNYVNNVTTCLSHNHDFLFTRWLYYAKSRISGSSQQEIPSRW